MITFECLPILSTMKALYLQPISPARFQAYLHLLQGDTKSDMLLPIASYNPMAKPHVLDKVNQLLELEAEALMGQVLREINQHIPPAAASQTIGVAINIADDLKGGWTNRYTTDYDSKFKINALVNRNFCVPHFWSSETYSADLIRERIIGYVYRTLYWLNNPRPKTLADLLKQEVFVAQKQHIPYSIIETAQFRSISQFYDTHQHTEDYNIIFNFFYGDQATQSLGYPSLGIDKISGFDYAAYLATR